MPHRLEITLKPDLPTAEGNSLIAKAKAYFGIDLTSVRVVHVLTIDADLTDAQLDIIRRDIFTNPVTQISAYTPLSLPFDLMIWVGYRPGVRDTAGSTAIEAINDMLGDDVASGLSVYTSKRYCIAGGGLTRADADRIAGELLANGIIQQWRVFTPDSWEPDTGIGMVIPKVILDHVPTVTTIPVDSDAALKAVSDARNLALHAADIPVIRAYFQDPAVAGARAAVGLSGPTDVEMEYVSQARSDHCNHNTFRGLFHYRDLETGEAETLDSLFRTFIEKPTLELQARKDWVVSVLWDNAGVGRFDDAHHYVITGETHNSPSNMEAYGGAITGIVGVYRDPLGTGKGARLIMGSYGFCTGYPDYAGDLKPHLHPRRLLDGVIEGVRDGGNKSGIPTPYGQVWFDAGYMGKCLVFVTALGLMPKTVDGAPSDEKATSPGELVIMCGGRVGKDGIHGVTASSESFSEHTPAGHVQIGDPYTQKKMHDFLLEARDRGLIRFITDNGGGGLSSSVGESARFSNGCIIHLEKVPLKYDGLDQWEIWVSESQERMTVAVHPDDLDAFMALSRHHAVESTVIGEYTDSGKLHITWHGKTCAYVDMDFLTQGFPQWVFDAHWRSPELRGMVEPVMGAPGDMDRLLLDMLSRPNICSKEWITRQYDHEVQGTSVIKPLVGAARDVPSDAAVIRPVLPSTRGLAFSQALLPNYAAIDAYHMTTCTIDEALRRLIAVGADPEQIGGVDNFCWPSIQYDAVKNPDGRFKAAQLVRSCRALKDSCLAYGIPLLSGKDSMYVDGNLPGRYGETQKVSALPTLQFSATGIVADVGRCVTMDAKAAGDRVYILGTTRNELGASELYQHFGHVGRNVPRVRFDETTATVRRVAGVIAAGLTASVHGIYRGGLAVHGAMVAMAGGLGLTLRLADVPAEPGLSAMAVLYSETPGRFIVTVAPENVVAFEAAMAGGIVAAIGEVTSNPHLSVSDAAGKTIIDLALACMKTAWQRPFGELI
ncbi:MAG: AIR synthase-related protein [Pseudomonadota bacterium]